MGKQGIRVFIAVLCLLQIFSSSHDSLTHAASSESREFKQMSNFWTMFSGVPILSDVLGHSAGLVCPQSEDGYHHASSYEVDQENGYYECICTECGWPFVAYETDLQQAYETQVLDLPVTGVTSSGRLLFNPFDYPQHCNISFDNIDYFSISELPFSYDNSSLSYIYSLVSGEYTYIHFAATRTTEALVRSDLYIDIIAPISGSYIVKNRGNITGYRLTASGSKYPPSDVRISGVSSGSFNMGNHLSKINIYNYDSSVSGLGKCIAGVLDYYPPLYEIIPTDSSTIANNYTIDSRPASITGDYGIIGDNGEITHVENTSIVNETNNTYTNPSTGTTSTITQWTYDYSDRSYNLTLESGDTVTVTYGDENVIIQEGDKVYNIYYIVDGSGQGTDPGVCQHEYTSTVDREPSCTVPGQTTYTCSLCGHTYTEAIPAKGHIWTVLQTVTTEYDQEGNLLQQGYTIYQCSVCGEQYKDETGTGPPDSGGGTGEDGESIWDKLGNLIGSLFGGALSIIKAILGAILDALTSLVAMIGEKLAAVVELVLNFFEQIPLLFTGFLGFLGAVFPFLPEEVMLLLTFGIAMIVFIGIIKALRR